MKNDNTAILEACYKDYRICGRTLFPDYFSRPFDKGHEQIFDLLHNSDNPLKLIIAPRGIGKTSIDNILVPAKNMLFHDKRYVIPIGSSHDTAKEQSENLKSQLIDNQSVSALFDVQKTSSFSADKWVVSISGQEACVFPRGAGQKIRGRLWKGNRPDLIIADDLEDEEMVKNEERRKDLKTWFNGAVMNAIDRAKRDWDIIVLGSLLHEDSLVANLAESKNWDSVVLDIYDEETGGSRFPNFMNEREIIRLRTAYKDDGELDVFYREYMAKVVPTGDSAFRQEYFKDYNVNETDLNNDPSIENIVVVDPAKTANPKSADSAIVGGAINLRKEQIFVRDIVRGKMHPDKLYDEVANMCLRLGARVLGVEVTGINEHITYPLKNHLSRRQVSVEFVELKARGGQGEPGKVTRIKSLIPFYRQGLVYHNSSCCSVLEGQLLSFPRSKLWDVMDALGYFPQMLEEGQRYMTPGGDEGLEDPRVIEDEYRELRKDYAMDEIDFHII